MNIPQLILIQRKFRIYVLRIKIQLHLEVGINDF